MPHFRYRIALTSLFRLLVTTLAVYIITQMLVFSSVPKSTFKTKENNSCKGLGIMAVKLPILQASSKFLQQYPLRTFVAEKLNVPEGRLYPAVTGGQLNTMVPPILIPKLLKLSRYIRHEDNEVVDLLGFPSSEQVYLTIGIRLNSTSQKDVKLAQQTLSSVLKKSGVQDRRHYVILVSLPFNEDHKRILLQEVLDRRYTDFVDSGMIQVIRPTTDIYVDEYLYTRLQRTHNLIPYHNAKFNIDEAFIYLYSRNLSKYFVEVRPGSSCASHFFKTLRLYIDSLTTKWGQIHFSENPVYGRLFRTDYLQEMAEDALYTYARFLPERRLNAYKTYFQYPRQSLFSYVETGETANISYYSRRDVVSQILRAKTINPTAKIFTDMRQYEDFELKNVYDRNPYTFFWSNGFDTGSYVTLSFRKPQLIKRIVVNTGSYINTDKLQSGILVAGQHFDNRTNACKKLTKQWMFIDGFLDIAESTSLNNICCVSIIVQSRQADWLMLRDIVVEVFR